MNQKSYRWYILIVATITQLCAAFSTQGFGIFAGFFQEDFILSNHAVGALAGSLNIAPIFGMLFIGKLIDRFGERVPIFLGMLAISISMLFMSLAHHYWSLLLALFFCGLGYSPIQPGGSKAIYSWFTTQQRGFAMGVRQAAIPFGGAIAAYLLPYIILRSNWRYAAISASILIITSGLLFFFIYRNKPLTNAKAIDHPYQNISGILSVSIKKIMQVGIILVSIQTSVLVFWILFIHQHFHVTIINSTKFLLALQIFGAIGRIALSMPGNFLKNGYSKIILTTTGILTILLAIIANLPSNTSHWIIMLISCILGFFCFGWYGPWLVWLSENSPSNNIGTILSTSMAFNQIAIVLTPFVFGAISDTSGTYTMSWFLLALIASIIFLKGLYAV